MVRIERSRDLSPADIGPALRSSQAAWEFWLAEVRPKGLPLKACPAVCLFVDVQLQARSWSAMSYRVSTRQKRQVEEVVKPAIVSAARGVILLLPTPRRSVALTWPEKRMATRLESLCRSADLELLDVIVASDTRHRAWSEAREVAATDYDSGDSQPDNLIPFPRVSATQS
jgi:DNA repair protein RadC